MKVFSPELWAIWCVAGIMLVAAIINARTLMVPNRLSIPATVTGWLAAIAVNCSIGVPSNGGGILASLVSTAIGFILLIPFYSAGWLGAGCVKMQMAYGAWVGAALSLSSAAWITASGTLAGGLVTTLAAAIAMKCRELKTDARPAFNQFPARITLSIGSLVGVIVPMICGWV